MLRAQRQEWLVDRLRRDGRLVARDLATELAVSEDSVRRDLRELAAAGLCQRVYGGALPVSPAIADYSTRQDVAIASKEQVAAAAAALVRPGSVAIIDGGTTALAVVAALAPDLEATVVTHSPTVAAALADHPGVEVQILGGRLFRHSMVACGAAAVEAAQGVSADVFLLGVTGVHHEAGLTTGDAEEAAMKRALVPAGRRHLRARQRGEDRRRLAVPGPADHGRQRHRDGRATHGRRHRTDRRHRYPGDPRRAGVGSPLVPELT